MYFVDGVVLVIVVVIIVMISLMWARLQYKMRNILAISGFISFLQHSLGNSFHL